MSHYDLTRNGTGKISYSRCSSGVPTAGLCREAPVLLALNSQIVMEQKATKKAKKVKSAPEITEASKRDVHGDTAANEKASTETETAISDDAILKTGFS